MNRCATSTATRQEHTQWANEHSGVWGGRASAHAGRLTCGGAGACLHGLGDTQGLQARVCHGDALDVGVRMGAVVPQMLHADLRKLPAKDGERGIALAPAPQWW